VNSSSSASSGPLARLPSTAGRHGTYDLGDRDSGTGERKMVEKSRGSMSKDRIPVRRTCEKVSLGNQKESY